MLREVDIVPLNYPLTNNTRHIMDNANSTPKQPELSAADQSRRQPLFTELPPESATPK
jgi:hypothetical protein